MTWFKVDDTFSMHTKVVLAGNAAIGLWVRCGAWSAQHLKDGVIPVEIATMLGRKVEIDALVKVGMFVKVGGGYRMHDYLDYQPSGDEVRAMREKRAEAGAKGGSKPKGSKPKANPEANTQASASDLLDDCLPVASDTSEPPSLDLARKGLGLPNVVTPSSVTREPQGNDLEDPVPIGSALVELRSRLAAGGA